MGGDHRLFDYRMKILLTLNVQRERAPFQTVGIEELCEQLGATKDAIWNDITYLEQARFIEVRSRQIGTRAVYTIHLTTKGIDAVNGPVNVEGFSAQRDTSMVSAALPLRDAQPLASRSTTLPRIFISHSHLDNDFCVRLYRYLEQHISGADIFLDATELQGGDEYMRRIPQELLERNIFIVVLSTHSVAAPWVQEETDLALRSRMADPARRIIPVLCEECNVDDLSPLLWLRQIIDCVHQAEETGFAQLVNALGI